MRPHTKVHKSPQIARMQVDAGAIGITTATAWEAIAMAEAGIDDILIARQVVGTGKLRALAESGAYHPHHRRRRLEGQPRRALGRRDGRRQHARA